MKARNKPTRATLPRNQIAPSQAPVAEMMRASAGGPITCPRFEPCTINPFVVPTSLGSGAWTGTPLMSEAGSIPPNPEKARQAK